MIISNTHHEAYLPAWGLIADQLDGPALRALFQCSRFFNKYVKNAVLIEDRNALVSKILRHYNGEIPKSWKTSELFSDETFRHSVCRLNLSGMPKLTNKQFCTLSSQFPQLTILILKGCKKLKDASFTKPKSAIEAPSQSLPKRFSHLRISKSSKKKQEAPSTLAQERWKNLRTLDISYCKHISDESMKALADATKELKVLNLNGCEKLTDEGVTTICKSSPNLTQLGIAATEATSETVDKITTLCPQIVQCNLSCLPVNDADLTIITKKLPALQGIGLDFCSSITKAGVTALFKNATKLETVTLVGCKQPKEVDALAKAHPHIQRIDCWNEARIEKESNPEVVDVLDSAPLRMEEWRGALLLQRMENASMKMPIV